MIPTQVARPNVKKSFKRIGKILDVGVPHAERHFGDVEFPFQQKLPGIFHPLLFPEPEEAATKEVSKGALQRIDVGPHAASEVGGGELGFEIGKDEIARVLRALEVKT